MLLVGPYDKLTSVLLSQFAIATLVDQPERLGGVPFQLYMVQPIAGSKLLSSHEAFVNNLQLLDNQSHQLRFNNSIWLATRWSFLRAAVPDYRTTFTYTLNTLLSDDVNHGLSVSSQCVSTSMRAGDQLIVTFPLPRSAYVPPSVTIFAISYTTMPLNVSFGPFHLENIRDQRTRPLFLQSTKGAPGIALSTS